MPAKTKKGQKKSKSLSWALAEQQLRKTYNEFGSAKLSM
jgi:hypothetical protein